MRAVLLLVFLASIWLLWSGIYQPLIIGFGALSCALTIFVCVRLRTTDEEGGPFHVIPRVLVYMPWLLLEILKSNLDLVKRILSRTPNVSPVLFEAPASQKTELGRVIYANSITLTPGTVSYAIEGDRILVHAIATEVRDEILSGEMDRRCAWIDASLPRAGVADEREND